MAHLMTFDPGEAPAWEPEPLHIPAEPPATPQPGLVDEDTEPEPGGRVVVIDIS